MNTLQEYLIHNPLPNFDQETELLTNGIKWLSENIEARDLEMNKSQGLAAQYAMKQNRVIRRVEDFITISPTNLKWLHDFILKAGLADDVFRLFFKIWSDYYRLNNNIENRIIKVIKKDEKN